MSTYTDHSMYVYMVATLPWPWLRSQRGQSLLQICAHFLTGRPMGSSVAWWWPTHEELVMRNTWGWVKTLVPSEPQNSW